MGLLCVVFTVCYFILFARIILSWVDAFSARPPDALQPVMKVVFDLTEPVMAPMRRIVPPVGGFDISPIIIFVVLEIVRRSFDC